MIRPATPEDAPAVTTIWNHVITTSLATFAAQTKTVEEVAALIPTRPVFLVAGDPVLGFATCFQFRGGDGYRHAAEHTILLSPDAQGQGLGRALMEALEQGARDTGFHTLQAGISAVNTAGLAFHSAIGFTEVGRIPEVGRKWDQWLDLVLMQKRLS